MDLKFTPEDLAFRDEVRVYLHESLPPDLKEKVARGLYLKRDDYVGWMKILHARGWSAPNWPVAYGGAGWTASQQYIFDDECAGVAPPVLPIGLAMVGPVLIAFGTEAQKKRFLPPILSADELWCQGYSEPDAGSDLAALSTRADRDGDEFVVNGTKIWTSKAHWADWMFTLVRTGHSGKKQTGISCLLIDMKSPGISQRPIHILNGMHYFSQVFLDDVRVPAANLIGEAGAGWSIAKYLLGHERSGASAEIGRASRRLADLKDASVSQADAARDRAAVEIDLMAVRYTTQRMLSDSAADRDIGPISSLVKIRGTETNQRITELTAAALGYYAAPYSVEVFEQGWNEAPIGPQDANSRMADFYECRKLSIWGGSNEIQRNVMAKRVLGL